MKRITYNPASALSILYAALLVRNDASLNIKRTDKAGTDMAEEVQKLHPRVDSYAVRILDNDPESDAAKRLALGIEATLSDISDFHTAEELSHLFRNNTAAIDAAMERGRIIESFLQSPSYEKFLASGKEVDPNEATNETPASGAPDPTAPATGVEKPLTEEETKGGTATTEDEIKNPVDGIETPAAVPSDNESTEEEAK